MTSSWPKAVLFDFMGTCLDWHSAILDALPPQLTPEQASHFALHWRQAYFDYNSRRVASGQPVQDFDTTQRIVLEQFLTSQPVIQQYFIDSIKNELITAWHRQPAWPDVGPALSKLKRQRQIHVHANGSTRLQIDLVRHAGLDFDTLMSSQLLEHYMPDTRAYERGLELLQLKPEDVVKVAAHAYDLRGAKAVGIKTVYVYRWTDDIDEDQERIKGENDAYITSMDDLDDALQRLRSELV